MIAQRHKVMQFRGGPHDGLRLVEFNISNVDQLLGHKLSVGFSVDESAAKYRVSEIVDDIVWCDYIQPGQ